MYIVMLNGHVACLKTTLSYLLAPVLKLGHISTSVLGEFVSRSDDKNLLKLRDQRYSKAAKITETYLREKQSIILDGNYTFRYWREEIYNLAVACGVSDVISVTCMSSRPEVVEERLAYRQRVPEAPDALANSMDAYWGSIKDFQPVDEDRLPNGSHISRIQFDSGIFEVSILESNSQHAQEVAGTIQQLISNGRLAQPLFVAPQPVSNSSSQNIAISKRRLWIELAGIGGSGKTTQCNLLKSSLNSIYPDFCISTFDEFSSSSLGDFLRSRLDRGNGFMLDFGESESSYLIASLTVLADNLKKGEIVVNDKAWNIAILDAYKWSSLAHTLAFVSAHTSRELREQVKYAIETLIEHFHPVLGEGITIFLDCPAEIAFKRLEKRHNTSFDDEFFVFLQDLKTAYDVIIANKPDIYRIDATQSNEAVNQEIQMVLKQRLSSNKRL